MLYTPRIVRDVQPGHVWEDQRRVRYYRREDFDRVRYALRVIDALRPPHMNILVREGVGEVRIDRGHQWDMPSGYTWAMVAVPPEASREEIALALIELGGFSGSPFLLDSLLALDAESTDEPRATRQSPR